MATALDKAQIASGTLAQWKRELDKATAAVAEGKITTWVIDSLTEGLGRNHSIILLTRALERLSEMALIETTDVNGVAYPTSVLDEEKANEILDGAADYIETQILRWYKPNSTSVSSVEVELYAHRADVDALKALRGKNF